MRMWKVGFGIVISLAVVLVFLSGSYVNAAKEEIKIGAVMNLTGPWASIDGPAWKGIQLAIDEINDTGGLLGKKVTATVVDTRADEIETLGGIIDLVEQKNVNAIIGYCDTKWVLIGAPIAREYGIPFITPGATHPRIPERSGAWLACFGDNAQAAASAEHAYETLGLRKVAVWIDTACDFSIAVCKYFADAFEHYGGEVVYEDFFETYTTDFTRLVKEAKRRQDAGEIDSIYVGAIPSNCGVIARQLREGGVTVPYLGADGFDTSQLVQDGGPHAEGTIFATHVSLESSAPKVVNFNRAYKRKWGVKPENAFAALGYDTMMLLAKAIKNIGSASPQKISASLSLIKEFPGVTGTLTYPPGSRVPNKSVALLEVKNGKFETVMELTPKYLSPPEIAQ